MRKIDALLSDYASHHATKGNVACHFVGIPLIVFGILSMLRVVRIAEGSGLLGSITLAEVFIVVAFAFYLSLNGSLALAMLVTLALLDGLALSSGNWRAGLAAFVVGWIFQGIGHAVYEKKSPSFLKNAVHLLVGPLFLVNEVLRIRHIEGPKAQGAGI